MLFLQEKQGEKAVIHKCHNNGCRCSCVGHMDEKPRLLFCDHWWGAFSEPLSYPWSRRILSEQDDSEHPKNYIFCVSPRQSISSQNVSLAS